MKITDAPEVLKPYLFHRVQLEVKGDEASGECPFCGHESFGVRTDTGLFNCFRCKAGGNALEFIRQLWQESKDTSNDLSSLAEERRLISESTLQDWEVGRSIIDNTILVAGRDYQNRVCQLYRYIPIKGKHRLLATPTFDHGLFGRHLFNMDCEIVYLCEGPWDAMALWELLRRTKLTENGLKRTGNISVSLGGKSSIVGLPGINVFKPDWKQLLNGKSVVIMFDNDHPKTHPKTGRELLPASYAATTKLASKLTSDSSPNGHLGYLAWGEHEFNPELPDGYDVRDLLTSTPGNRLVGLERALGLITHVTEDMLELGGKESKYKGLSPKPCKSFSELITAWESALKWSTGLEHALVVMLSSVASVKTAGDQLWVKVISPPSTGKTILCEALSTNRKYIVPVSSFRGFHSGYRQAGDTEKTDYGLLGRLGDMTMVMKDGDTLLQAPNLTQILAEGRDLYDGASRSHYRNATGKNYENIRMTWILCGTAALRQIDSSELGERFLDCVIMDQVEDEEEDEILWIVANKASRAVTLSTDGQAGGKYDRELLHAMRLTGGYIDYLKDQGPILMPKIEMEQRHIKGCITLGKFVAYMRARPSIRQIETAERELAARLVSQHVRLAKCACLVMNKMEVDEEVMAQVRQVSLDTARGRVLLVVKHLYDAGKNGMENKSIALLTNQPEAHSHLLLRFMRQIKMVEIFRRVGVGGVKGRKRWRLKPNIRQLFERVVLENRLN